MTIQNEFSATVIYYNSINVASPSACFLAKRDCFEVSSKYALNLSINDDFSAVAAEIRSD